MGVMMFRLTGAVFFAMLSVCLAVGQAQAAPKTDAEPAAINDDQGVRSDNSRQSLNRAIFRFNQTVDTILLRPVASGYQAVVPQTGRDMVSNAVANIYTPVTFANSIFQGDPQNALAALWRFLLNSTVGIAGLFDVAGANDLKMRTTDFGQTLAIYGAEPGHYVVLPIIGPSNLRDSVGRLTDAFINPFNYVGMGFSGAMWGTTAIDTRSRNMKVIDDIYSSSIDPYSTFRSAFTQHRAADIRRAKDARAASRRAAGLE